MQKTVRNQSFGASTQALAKGGYTKENIVRMLVDTGHTLKKSEGLVEKYFPK